MEKKQMQTLSKSWSVYQLPYNIEEALSHSCACMQPQPLTHLPKHKLPFTTIPLDNNSVQLNCKIEYDQAKGNFTSYSKKFQGFFFL